MQYRLKELLLESNAVVSSAPPCGGLVGVWSRRKGVGIRIKMAYLRGAL